MITELTAEQVARYEREGYVLVEDAFDSATVEAVRQGSRGLATNMQLFLARPWGFRPEEIRVPVHLWYGDADTLVPLQMGQYLAQAIPGSRLTVYPAEGHMIFYSHWREILDTLAAAGR